MSLLKKLAGETAIYGISSILGRLINWVALTPYLTRVFTTGEYGIVNELYTYIALLMVLFTYRLETAFFRYGREAQHRQRAFQTASVSIVGTALPLLALLIGLAPAIAAWLKYPSQVEYVVLFSVIVALDALAAIPFAQLRLEGRPIRFAAIKLGAIFINILILFFMLEVAPRLQAAGWHNIAGWYTPADRIAYVFWANLLASALTLLWLAPLYFRRKGGGEAAPWFDARLWRQMMAYGLPLVLAGLAGVVNQLIGVPLLKAWASPDIEFNKSLAGIYAAAAKLAILMNLFIQAFNYAAEPFFFRYSAQSDNKAIFALVARAFALVGSLAFLGIVFYVDLIQYFLGRDFREGLGILPILLAANFFLGLYFNFAMSFKLTDQTPIGGYIALGGMAITLLVNWLFIPSMGYYAPAWASLACYGFMGITSYWVGRRIMPVDYPVGIMARYLLLALALYGLSIAFQVLASPGLPLKMGVHTALLLTYIGALYRWEGPWWKGAGINAD
jgi:O-antigen/teichoic acid export membrane protein